MGAVVQRVENEEHLAFAARRAVVLRVAGSDLFQKSPRLREFLLYVADCTLNKRLAEVREQVIAERVFSRRADFQGAQDSIVRAEARNLRKRLETYFATEGRNEPLVILMPRGGYALVFESRAVEALPAPLPAAAVLGEDARPAPAEPNRVLWLSCLAAFLVAVLASGFALYWRQADVRLTKAFHVANPVLPFSALFREGREGFIVTSDTGFLQISALAHRPLSLNDFIARSYPEVPGVQPSDLIRNWNLYEFTDGREMSVAGLILRNYPQFAGRIALRSGHEVTLDDLKSHDAILIGSPISNPWAQLFEDRLNFRCSMKPSGPIVFSETAGAQYPSEDDVHHNRTYARVAFLPASAEAPAALLIAGNTAQSTEAAGQLVADSARLARTLRSAGIDPVGPPHFFEILLRSNVFVGGSTVPEIVAWRLQPAPEE